MRWNNKKDVTLWIVAPWDFVSFGKEGLGAFDDLKEHASISGWRRDPCQFFQVFVKCRRVSPSMHCDPQDGNRTQHLLANTNLTLLADWIMVSALPQMEQMCHSLEVHSQLEASTHWL